MSNKELVKPYQRRSRQQRERDLLEIERRWLRSESQTSIGAALGLSQQTISRDCREIERRWRAETVMDLERSKLQELRRLNEVERQAWVDYERSRGEPTSVFDAETGAIVPVEPATPGDPRFLVIVQRCIERRIKLLGLDEPMKLTGSQDVKIKVLSGVSMDDL
jgi:hypothetical protein